MKRCLWSLVPASLALAMLISGGSSSGAVSLVVIEPPVIRHEAVEYVPEEQFPQIEVTIESEEQVETVKLYFKAAQYEDFYFVEMTPSESEDADDLILRAILPRPAAGTQEVSYFIEAVNVTKESVRTATFAAEVTSAPVPGAYTGSSPNITVGATRAGMAPMPPGFQAAGITGFLSSAGVVTAASGGIGAGTVGLAGAGVAGAVAGVAVLASSDESQSSTSVPVTTSTVMTTSTTTSVTTTTTTSPPVTSLRACYTTSPDPAHIEPGGVVRFDASCSTPRSEIVSYSWEFNDGRGGNEGRVVSHVFTDPGIFAVALTVQLASGEQDERVRSIVVEEPNTADVALSGGVASNIPTRITYRIGIDNAGPRGASGLTFVVNFPDEFSFVVSASSTIPNFSVFANCMLAGTRATCDASATLEPGDHWEILVEIQHIGVAPTPLLLNASVRSNTPDPNLANNGGTISTPAALSTLDGNQGVRTAFTSTLDAVSPRGVVQGQVIVDQVRTDRTDSGAPFLHGLQSATGEHVVEALLTSEASEEGRWRFDFANTTHFVPGSLRVQSGDVIASDASSLVFRLSGAQGQRVRFTYLMMVQ